MKLLLTSAGIKNPSINDALGDMLGKPVAECDALCIPTASYGHAPNGIRGAYRFITGQATTPMCELGWTSLGVLELTALPSIDQERWVPTVRETDGIRYTRLRITLQPVVGGGAGTVPVDPESYPV